MKNLFFILILAVSFSSCKKYLDAVSQNPNDPSTTTPALLLASAEVGMFDTYTGNLARTTSMWIQQSSGTDGQYITYGKYDVGEGDINNEWDIIYADNLLDCQNLIDLAGDESPWYRGMGRVLKAMMLGIATDGWGAVPNSEALMGLDGSDFYNPAYDDQQSVYADIQTLLDDAITDLSQPITANALLPAGEDFIYGGDADAWIMAARMLKARHYIHLAEVDGGAAASALSVLNTAYTAGLTDGSFDMNAYFAGGGSSLNQWYAFNNERGGYLQMGEFFIDLLNGNSDPRLPVYADTGISGGYTGSPTCSIDNTTSVIGSYLASSNSDMPLVTYHEMKFIEAEAKVRNSDVTAGVALAEAVQANMDYMGVSGLDAAAYILANVPVAPTLQDVMMEKYRAMFTQFEAWTDWRRTGFPSLTPAPCGVLTGIPVRFPTSQNERTYNSNAQVEQNLLTPVWWDN